MGYYKHYRRPYFGQRRSRKGGNLVWIKAIVLFLLLLLLSHGTSSTQGEIINFVGKIIQIIILLIPSIIVVFIIWKAVSFFNKDPDSRDTEYGVANEKNNYSINRRNTENINARKTETMSAKKEMERLMNSEKHGCKCYKEGLDNVGEKLVAEKLSHELSYRDYFIFNNLIIPSRYIESSQIDHVVVSRFGIFVIETKHMSESWILGFQSNKKWIQSFPGGENRYTFSNPLLQNYSHIQSLSESLPFIDKKLFESIAVFTGTAEIKSNDIKEKKNVLYLDDLVDYIKDFTIERIPEEKIHSVIGKIAYLCQTNNVSTQQHVDNLRKKHPQIETSASDTN